VRALLPATVAPERVALVGLHSWTEDDYPNVARWGTVRSVPSPRQANLITEELLD
jgi:arginase